MKQDFLVELGLEELPPKSLLALSNAFLKGIEGGLKDKDLSFDGIKAYATPRRLAVVVTGLVATTAIKEIVNWGPPVKIAFDSEGKPSKAALAFANKNAIDAADLVVGNDGKVDKLVFKKRAGGEPAVSYFEGIVQQSLIKLPIPKRMRWGSNRHDFVRPVHWLVMLFGDTVVEANILGLQAGRLTRGHRFHYNQSLSIDHPSEYEAKLANVAYVMADMDKRRNSIRVQVLSAAKMTNGEAVIDANLLEEVTALVEWPVALMGRFESRFLSVPAEALISSMKEHQKYFHVIDQQQKLLPYFITVANIESKDPAQVIDGNERVIRPRLSDAAFFFETDKKTTLTHKREQLKKVVFQVKLGTTFEKTTRVASLAKVIAKQLGVDEVQAERAGQLCKSDLVSEMVYEFADMQGIAGFHYAHHDGETADVALAMNEHYLPRFAGDKLPTTMTGNIVALADRLDTLVGIFGIGEQPTGSKDPFALRRASVGVLRLLIEQSLNLDLRELLASAFAQYKSLNKPLSAGEAVVEQVLQYMLERLRSWYEEQDIPVEVFQAVSVKKLSFPLDINQRIQAVNHFRLLDASAALAAANKRVANIVAKAGDAIPAEVDTALLQEPAERALAKAVAASQKEVTPLFKIRDYKAALTALASLQDVVDTFFEDVMVMSDDVALRNNRLALLLKLRALFFEVADISCLSTTK
jgi:glycyl-tRNA synthetase beta chain